MRAAPAWEELAARARGALSRLKTVEATVRIVEPKRGFAGAPATRTIEVRWAYPDLWRIDDVTGPVLVRDGRRHIERDESGAMRQRDRNPDFRPDDVLGLGWGHPRLFLEPDAFREPVAGPETVEVAGRAAWAVTLSAPGNKPYLLVVLIDDKTGLPLGHRAEGTPYQAEVQFLRVDEPLPAETFNWDGPVATAVREDESGRAEDDAPDFPRYWPTSPTWTVLFQRSDGLFARLHSAVGTAALHRRPRGTAEPSVEELMELMHSASTPLVYRKDAGPWSWILLSADALGEQDLLRFWQSLDKS